MTNPVASDISKILSSNFGGVIDLRPHVSDDDFFSSLTISILNEPNQGRGFVQTNFAGSSIVYRPDANARGTDVLTYQVADTDGNTDTGTVTIANTDLIVVPSSGSAVIDLLANDLDAEGDTLSIRTSAGLTPQKGAIRFTEDNQIIYTPFEGESGHDHTFYYAEDGVSSSLGSILITITDEDPINSAPVALDDVTSVSKNEATTIIIGSNDSDPNGDELTTSSLTNPTKGTAVYTNNIGSSDSVLYTPFSGAAGTDSFTYQVADPSGLTSTATVSITFENSAPIANDDTAVVSLGDTIQINVGLNDSDADDDQLTTSLFTNPSQGTASVTDNTNFYDFISYTPNSDASGIESFTYQISDGNGGTNTASVDIVILDQTGEVTVTGPEVYRFFNTQSGTHFYSKDEFEANSILANLPHYRLDGPAFKAADATNGTTADVFRFFNTQSGTHLFTQDTNERDTIIATMDHFNFEGIAYQGHPNPVDGSVPLYRFFNTQTGGHFYTVNEAEKDNLIATASNVYNFESVAYNVYRPTDVEIAPVQSDTTPLLGVISTIESDLGAL